MMAMSNAQVQEPFMLNVKYDRKIYLLYYQTFATNTQASDICSKQGGDLVNIFGAEVNRQIFNTMKSLIGTNYFQDENIMFNETWSFWISKYAPRLNMNNFVPEFKQYSNWYLDVLGSSIGSNNGYSYGCPNVLLGTGGGLWGVAPCNKQMPFVCEIPKEDGKIETQKATYSIYIQSFTREKAKALCTFTSGHLPFISSEEENTILANTVKEYVSSTWTSSSSSYSGFWAGVVNTSADFATMSYDDGTNAIYNNWAEGQPSAYNWYPSLTMRQYVIVDIYGKWRVSYDTFNSNNPTYFVCQYTKQSPTPQVNLSRIEEWANITDWFKTSTPPKSSQGGSVSNITINVLSNTTNEYNYINSSVTNSITTINTTNEQIVNTYNSSLVANNYTLVSNNVTNVYDRKMMNGHSTVHAIFWTLIAIGSFIILTVCLTVIVCVSCWCCHRL
jgi:hypothetical protein